MPITGAGAAAGEKQKTKKRAEGKRKRKSQRDLIGEAVDCIRPLVEDFMEGIKLDGGSVEWWAHIRSGDNAAGHQYGNFDMVLDQLLRISRRCAAACVIVRHLAPVLPVGCRLRLARTIIIIFESDVVPD